MFLVAKNTQFQIKLPVPLLNAIRSKFDNNPQFSKEEMIREVKELYTSEPYVHANMWEATRDFLRAHSPDASVIPN